MITNRISKLGLHQLREISALMHQVAEIPALDDAALLEDQDQVRIPNGRQPVGNDEGGAPLFQIFESLLHLGFGCGVQVLVASSRIRMGGFLSSTRAIDRR